MVSFPRGALRGTIAVPADKSISHRALILQAFARGAFAIENINPGADVLATQRALHALDPSFDRLRMTPDERRGAVCEIACMNSGSTARMLLGVCAGANVHARFDGDASLRRRPMEPVAAQLRAFGARIETADGHLPLEIFGCERIQTRRFILLSPSAQVKSALLFAGLFAGVQIGIAGDAGSRDHTERLLRYQGAQISWSGKGADFAAPPSRFKNLRIAGDFSAAAFFITAATIAPGSELTIRDVGVNPTRTGLLDALRLMGADIELREERELCGEPIADIRVRHAELHGVAIERHLALRAIDEIPLLAVAAAFAHGETTIAGIGDLRTKESDRIAAIQGLLGATGIASRATPTSIVIAGGRPEANGTSVRSHDDHRIAMAAAVLACAAGPIELDDASSVDVSFPAFLATLRQTRES
ncbi:MAG: 3-phosphoshikimate 1-carboxyvinyltransferase [Candidatus Tyrphobacter sp.]